MARYEFWGEAGWVILDPALGERCIELRTMGETLGMSLEDAESMRDALDNAIEQAKLLRLVGQEVGEPGQRKPRRGR